HATEILESRVREPAHEDGSVSGYCAQAGDEDQSTPVPGDGSALHAPARPAAAPEAGIAEQPLPRDGGGGRGGGDPGGQAGGGEEGRRGDRLGGDPAQRLRGRGTS